MLNEWSMEKLLPHFVRAFRGFELGEETNKLQQQCAALAIEVGSDEAEGADAVELLESHKEEMSNEELMHLHELLVLVPMYPEADICDENVPIQDMTKDVLM
jgi:hypothetical protein